MRRVWFSMVVAVLSACPTYELPDGGHVIDAGTGQLLLVFDGDFGEVERFHTAENPARFINVGDVPASVSRLSVEGEGFSIGDYDGSPIAPGAAREIPVKFRPTRNGSHTARISFQATTLPVLAHFSMQGTGVGALVKVPGSLELGAHLISDFETLRVDEVLRIENVGDRWLYFPSVQPWTVSPAEELCIGDIDLTSGRCLGTVRNVDVAAGIAPGRTLELPVHFVSPVPGERAWTLTLKTSLLDAPLLEVPVHIKVTPLPTCRLVADQPLLDFGDLEPMRASDLSFTLRNDGTAACTALMPSIRSTLPSSVASFAVIEPRSWPRSLQPGERVELTVRAQPTLWSGVTTGFVAVGHTGVQLRVTSAPEPCVEVTAPASLGAWNPTCAAPSGTLSFKNRCLTPVQVPALTTSSEQFEVSTGFPLPRTILADTSLEALITPAALGEGEYRATWTLDVQTDWGTERHRRQVRAQVVPGVAKEVQKPLEKVDVLVIYDRSALGLSSTQSELANLYSRLVDTNVDFQLGVIRSNDDDGRLLAWPSGLKWATATLGSDAALQGLISGPQTLSSGNAMGSLSKAMTPPLATEPSEHEGFFRTDASLVVMMIGGVGWVGEDDLDHALLRFKPGVRDFVVHVVACGNAANAMQQRMANATGGTISNCATPWTGALNDLVASVRGRRKRMHVASEVTPGSMTVPGLSASSWFYVEPWLTIPEGRTTIETQFTPRCR